MPYINPIEREVIDRELEPLSEVVSLTPGQLNYIITKLAHKYIERKGGTYDSFNAVVGVLECAKQEFYRRKVVPYEDKKIEENGDL